MDHLHWQKLLAKPLPKAKQDSCNCTCLGHLDKKIDMILFFVTLPKVAKAQIFEHKSQPKTDVAEELLYFYINVGLTHINS
jgi:hypothetical protein